jgi:2-keto-4-pentenoate hydratase
VNEIDPRLASALASQLESWRSALRGGAQRVGWKLGMGDRERIGSGPVLGHLTSATRLEPGGVYRAGAAGRLSADAEIALEIGRDVDPGADSETIRRAVAGFGAALELVDLGGRDDPEQIVAANVFHRAFALGSPRPALPAARVEARLIVNGRVRASAHAPSDVTDRVAAAAQVLGAMGEQLRAGDQIITGSVVQVPVEPGDEVVADLGPLGRVGLAIAP